MNMEDLRSGALFRALCQTVRQCQSAAGVRRLGTRDSYTVSPEEMACWRWV